jgi:hypothetical protein
MNPHLSWKPFQKVEFQGKTYEVLSRIDMEDDFVCRRKFMLVFPDGEKRMLSLSATMTAIENYDGAFGPGAHEEFMRENVKNIVMGEIVSKAHAKCAPPSVQPDVKLVPLDLKPLAGTYTNVDFAKVESQMMAQLFAYGGLPSDVYGPVPVAKTPTIAKAQQVMAKAVKKFADKFMPNLLLATAKTAAEVKKFGALSGIVWDSLAGMSKVDTFKAAYGGTPEPQPQLTPKGLATLKKFGVALAG